MQATISRNNKLKYHVYEGTAESRDETYRFSRKAEALKYIKGLIELKETLGLPYIAHLIVTKTGEFVFTDATSTYQAHADEVTRELVARTQEIERYNKREALRTEFNRIEAKCNELFNKGNHMRHEGHQDAWLLCASALDNAGDTAQERGFEVDGLEYWECALGSLQSLCCDAKPRVRRWFKKIGLKF